MTKFTAKDTETNALIEDLRGKVGEGDKAVDKVSIASDGNITLAEGVEDTLYTTAGVTEEEVKKVQEAQSRIVTAVDTIAIERSLPHFKSNKDAKSTSLEMHIGHNTHNLSIERSGNIVSATTVPSPHDNGDMKAIRTKAAKLFEKLDS